MSKKDKKKIYKVKSKSNKLIKLKSQYKKGILKFSSNKVASAIFEDLGSGIVGKKRKKQTS